MSRNETWKNLWKCFVVDRPVYISGMTRLPRRKERYCAGAMSLCDGTIRPRMANPNASSFLPGLCDTEDAPK